MPDSSINHFKRSTKTVSYSNGLVVLTNLYEILPCKCFYGVGIRLDNKETAVVYLCCKQHKQQELNVLNKFKESLKNPVDTHAFIVLKAIVDEEFGGKPN